MMRRGYKFTQGCDRFWDDDFDIDLSILKEYDDDEDSDQWDSDVSFEPTIENEVPSNDSEIIQISQN